MFDAFVGNSLVAMYAMWSRWKMFENEFKNISMWYQWDPHDNGTHVQCGQDQKEL
jgi:hypothetical protein